MTIIRIPHAGQYGINKDLSEHELPPNAWTDASNIRFLDGSAYQFYGHGAIYDPPPVVPYHIAPVLVGTARYWLVAGAGKIYCVNASTYTDLTRGAGGDYSGTRNSWVSCSLSGIPVLTDGSGVNYPQSWDLNTANNFGDLANWPANTYCKSIRAFKNYLIALNITKTTTNYPYMVKWSHAADPGAVPTSWDAADAAKDAGEFDLAQGGDAIVDGLGLRESFIIYKTNSCWRMDYVGGAYVFQFTKIGGTSGLLARNCVVEIDGWHFAVTGSDIVMHDGATINSVLDKMMRRDFFADIDTEYYGRTFVAKNEYMNEVWVCYPSVGNAVPNKALVYNWKDRTVSLRELPNINHAAHGLVESGLSNTWSSDADPWNSDLTGWNQPDYTPDAVRLVMASNDTHLYMADTSAYFAGAAPTAYVERIGLSFGAPETRKLVRSIRPRIRGSAGGTVLVSVGQADDPYTPPSYTEMTHTIGTTVANDCLVNGRYIAIKFTTGTAAQWRLDSYDIDIEEAGIW